MKRRFLLSHHHPEHENRCVLLLGRPVCARCLGMYPPLLLGLGILFALDAAAPGLTGPLAHEGSILIAATVPALVDWGRGRLRPSSGSNTLRVVTGASLGLALARTIHLHAREPFQEPSLEVLLFLVIGVAAAEVVVRALRE